eukprot:1116817-Rhodomonas_salina.4
MVHIVYARSSTDTGPPSFIRACYAVSGTEVGYATGQQKHAARKDLYDAIRVVTYQHGTDLSYHDAVVVLRVRIVVPERSPYSVELRYRLGMLEGERGLHASAKNNLQQGLVL